MGSTVESEKLASLLTVPFSMIPRTPVYPLWPGWFLRRHVTLLVAPGGTGKGLLTIDMAARVSRGWSFPGEERDGEPLGSRAEAREPEAVIIVAPEDDPNEAVAWRLRAAGADTSLVFNLTTLPDGTPFTLPESVTDGSLAKSAAEIEAVTGRKVGLIIIDPLYACVTRPLTTNAAARRVIMPLEKVARDTSAAVVLTHHTVKSGATAGAKGLTDAVRAVLRIGRSSEEVETPMRVLSVEKANAMSDTASLRYVIAGEDNSTALTWPVDSEQVAAKLSSRGYLIDPDMAPGPSSSSSSSPPAAAGQSAPTAANGTGKVLHHLYVTVPGTNARALGQYGTAAEARHAAAGDAEHHLTWKSGPVVDSHSAAYGEGNARRWYSILPVEPGETPAQCAARAAKKEASLP